MLRMQLVDPSAVARRESRLARAMMNLECLEVRRMLSAPADVAPLIDQKLWQVVQATQDHANDDLVRAGVAKVDLAGRIETYVRVSRDQKPGTLTDELTQLGARVVEANDAMGALDVWLPADKVDDVARLAGVIGTQLPDYPVTNVVTTAGDGILKADKVRSQFAAFGIDGTGIKIGVISDGANHRANVGAELPSVTVDPSHPGNGDEGTAMLEIVHDLAPGAQLYFSGPSNSLQMPACITYLQNQGCNVIVDDLSFFGEGYFTDTTIANAAQAAVNAGVVYVTSAGNYSDGQHYQSLFVQSASATADGRLHRFNLSPIADADNVNIPVGSTFRAFMEWSDPWGGSSNNYDFYLYNSDTFAQLDASTSLQDGQAGDLPFESLLYTNNTGSTVHAQIWVEKKNTAATREFEFFTIGNSTMAYDTPSDALVGHEAIPGVMAVAAANAVSPTSVTSYSSRGGSTIYSNLGNSQISSVRTTLDGTAIDGVQTDVGQLGFFFNPFYGTSAAAPHAAAIAALLKQANASLTPAQVSQIMADTATDLGAAGYDTTSGAGLYNALDGVYKAFTPGAADLTAASDLGPSSTDNITNDTTPSFTGTVPLGSYVRLFVDGVQQAAVQLAAGVSAYSLTTGALSAGNHTVTIRVASSSTIPLSNNSNLSSGLNITIDTTAPTLNTSAFNYDVPAQNLTFNFSESVAGSVQAGDLSLMNNTTASAIPVANIAAGNSPNSAAVFTFPGYAFGALPDGKYTATIAAANITDVAGNPLGAPATLDFFFLNGDANHDGIVDVADLGVLATNWQLSPRTFSSGDFNYDSMVDVTDLGILATNWQESLPVPAPVVQSIASATVPQSHHDETLFADDSQILAELA